MTKDDITRMAREAGEFLTPVSEQDFLVLETFANLVAAAEREECAKVCEAQDATGSINQEWMRERCATAIRARGNT